MKLKPEDNSNGTGSALKWDLSDSHSHGSTRPSTSWPLQRLGGTGTIREQKSDKPEAPEKNEGVKGTTDPHGN